MDVEVTLIQYEDDVVILCKVPNSEINNVIFIENLLDAILEKISSLISMDLNANED